MFHSAIRGAEIFGFSAMAPHFAPLRHVAMIYALFSRSAGSLGPRATKLPHFFLPKPAGNEKNLGGPRKNM
jgi:hypothetical protein